MKIYKAKGFELGVVMVLVGGFYAMVTMMRAENPSFLKYLSAGVMISVGFYALFGSLHMEEGKEPLPHRKRSSSKNMDLKSKAATLQLIRVFMALVGLPAVIYGTQAEIVELQAIGITMGFCWNLTLLFEVLALIYYELKTSS